MIDITQHGVVPDGRDCSEAFNRLVDGEKYFFPPGTYIFKTPVSLDKKVLFAACRDAIIDSSPKIKFREFL
jgi:hypothetical protein